MWFKNWWRHIFKNVLYDVTQVMTLWNCSKETAHCRDHPSRSFRTPRNEVSQNLKPLSTSESLKTILSTSEAQELHPASWQAQKHILCVHGSLGILSPVRSLVLSGLVSCITLQAPSLLWSSFVAVHDSFWWSNLIGASPMWRLEQKQNRQTIFPLCWTRFQAPGNEATPLPAKNRLGTRLIINGMVLLP